MLSQYRYHTNKMINYFLTSSNSQFVFNFSQLPPKCLFRVLVPIRPEQSPHIAFGSLLRKWSSGPWWGLSECWLLLTTPSPAQPSPTAWHQPLLPSTVSRPKRAPPSPLPPAPAQCSLYQRDPWIEVTVFSVLPLNRQGFSIVKMSSSLCALQGSQGVRGPQGITGPKGTTVSDPGPPGQRWGPVNSVQAPRERGAWDSRLNCCRLCHFRKCPFCALVFPSVNRVVVK